MAENCKECGKKLPILPIRDLCPDCEFKLKHPDEKSAKPATIYCRLCAAKLFPESKFCPSCGQPVREAPTTKQETDHVDLTDSVDLHPKPTAQTAYQQQEYQPHQSASQSQPAAPPQRIPQPVPQPVPKEDPMEKLAKLKKMVEAGLITEEDYNTKKTEILSKM